VDTKFFEKFMQPCFIH